MKKFVKKKKWENRRSVSLDETYAHGACTTLLASLSNLEELHCYALTEPPGHPGLVKMPHSKCIAGCRLLNEWERYRFKKLQSDVVFI